MPETSPASDGRALTRFARVERTRTHVYIAEQLRREIALGVLPTGIALPPERELAAMFGVARATVQRAVRMLEGDGLVITRRGRRGGTFVTAPASDVAGRGRLLAELRANRALIEEAIAYRLDVEPSAAGLAALARTDEDLAGLRTIAALAAATADDALLTGLDAQFHTAVAAAAHNRFFGEAVARVRVVLNDAILLLPESPLWQQRSIVEHERILAALEARGRHAAEQAVLAHVQHTARNLRVMLKAV